MENGKTWPDFRSICLEEISKTTNLGIFVFDYERKGGKDLEGAKQYRRRSFLEFSAEFLRD